MLRRFQSVSQALVVFSPSLALLFGSLLRWPGTTPYHGYPYKTNRNASNGQNSKPTSALDGNSKSYEYAMDWIVVRFLCWIRTSAANGNNALWSQRGVTDHCADLPLGAQLQSTDSRRFTRTLLYWIIQNLYSPSSIFQSSFRRYVIHAYRCLQYIEAFP